MNKVEYTIKDGRKMIVKYDRLGVCKVTRELMESFIDEMNTAYEQARQLEAIKDNYLKTIMPKKVAKWITNKDGVSICSECGATTGVPLYGILYCPMCGLPVERINKQ